VIRGGAGPRGDATLRLAAELRSGDEARAVAAADAASQDDWVLAPLLINLLAWDRVTQTAREALRRMGPKVTA
jgi:hypothetical protein